MSKDSILNNIKRHTEEKFDMPDLDNLQGIRYPDVVAKFIEVSKGVGGDALILADGEELNARIRALYTDAKSIASNIPGITLATINPDDVDDPRSLNGTDLAIVKGEVGVAENACVWIPQNVKEKAVYFIAEYLVIVLEKKNLVHNMHEAYAKIEFNANGFGVFISGPSKTADIEQSLVVGAHGAKGVTVVLI